MKIAAGDGAGAQQASTGVCTRLGRALLYAVPPRASSHFSRPNGNHEAMLHRLCSAYNSCAPLRPSSLLLTVVTSLERCFLTTEGRRRATSLDRASTLPLSRTKALKGSGCVKPTISRVKLSGWCFPCLSCPAPGEFSDPERFAQLLVQCRALPLNSHASKGLWCRCAIGDLADPALPALHLVAQSGRQT